MGKAWDKALPSVDIWRECLRVLKPGAFAFVMCIPRQDCLSRMIINLEDAGFMVNFSPIYHTFACLSEDTEILTKHGWERLQKTTKYGIIKVEQSFAQKEILAYDTDSGAYRWEVPTGWNVFPVEDTCYRIESATTDQLVSRGHRVAIEQGGEIIFRFAETLGQTIRVPYLDSLRGVWDSLSHDTRQNQSGAETKFDGQILQPAVQRHGTVKVQERTKQATEHRRPRLDRRTEAEAPGGNDRREELGMERRGNVFQNAWQLLRRQIHSLSERISFNGAEGRLCYGTSNPSSSGTGTTALEVGSGTPYRPRPDQQSDRQLDPLRVEQGSQATRTRTPYQTTLATVRPEHYSGIVFCPTVSTGCFVARRNGKIFLTGNSGFPKAANLSKLADRRLGVERLVVGVSNNNVYNKGYSLTQAGNFADKQEGYAKGNITAPATPEAKALEGSYAGLQMKPAVEVVLCVMRPLSEKTYLDQALTNGHGCTHLDAGRIPYEGAGDKASLYGRSGTPTKGNTYDPHSSDKTRGWNPNAFIDPTGRFAPNLLCSDDVLNDGRVRKSGAVSGTYGPSNPWLSKCREGETIPNTHPSPSSEGSYSRYFSLDAWAAKNLPESANRTFPFLIVPKAAKSEKQSGLEEGYQLKEDTPPDVVSEIEAFLLKP